MAHKQYRYKHRVDEIQCAKNRTKSRVGSKVEYVFALMKLKFGFVKVRYRGLKKNANRLFATCAPGPTYSWYALPPATDRPDRPKPSFLTRAVTPATPGYPFGSFDSKAM